MRPRLTGEEPSRGKIHVCKERCSSLVLAGAVIMAWGSGRISMDHLVRGILEPPGNIRW